MKGLAAHKKTMIGKLLFFGALLVFLVSVTGATSGCGNGADGQNLARKGEGEHLLIYSGAGLRHPVNEVSEVFAEEFGVEIKIVFGGSGHILSQARLAGKGDVFIPGSLYFFDIASEEGLVECKQYIAYHVPVIAVPEGNAARIKGLPDLGRPGVEVILGDEKVTAIGRVTAKIIAEAGLTGALAKNTVGKTVTATELVTRLVMGQADAAIVWEPIVTAVEGIEVIEIAEEQNQVDIIPASVFKKSQNKEAAREFIDFLTSERGREIFRKHGFKPVE